jgi:hypothetical protein
VAAAVYDGTLAVTIPAPSEATRLTAFSRSSGIPIRPAGTEDPSNEGFCSGESARVYAARIGVVKGLAALVARAASGTDPSRPRERLRFAGA